MDTMSRSSYSIFIIATLFLCFVALPVGAVIQEVTAKGTVSTANQVKNTLTINNPAQYGCTYPSSGAPTCTWTPLNISTLTGTVPDAAAFTVFKTGDPVIGTSTGGAGDTWVTLAKLYGSRPNEEFITDIIGEPGTIPTPLIGNYKLDIATAPDCTQCSGVTCVAKSSDVILLSSGRVASEKILMPGETLTFNGRNDGSMVSVTFVKGQALSSTCPQAQMGTVGGVQPISDYIVTVVPPISFSQNNIRTATTTRPDEALSTTAVTSVALSPALVVPVSTAPVSLPTKSGTLPFIAAGALGLAGILVASKKG